MRAPSGSAVKRSGGLLVYLLVLVSLQIFLLVVALEGVTGHEPGLATAAATLSVALFGVAAALRWFVGHD